MNEELKRLQSLPLEDKIALTKLRINEWYEHWGGQVYVSVSGGKDSTVLLRIAREVHPDILAVYCDTGLEYPEVKANVKSFDNLKIIRPELSFRQVIEKYGWTFPSKDVAYTVQYAKRGSKWAVDRFNGVDKDGKPSKFRERYKKWKYLMDAPFEISSMCCEIMKERPMQKFERQTKLKPIVGIMATESMRRQQAWERTGCNAFDAKRPMSKPMSFWTEQDVLRYIKENDVQLPSVYGKIIEDNGKLHCTGEERTGCCYCMIGAHLDHPNKFQRLKQTHPKIYDYCMNQLGMNEILNWLKIEH